jgi:hypothetical protein
MVSLKSIEGIAKCQCGAITVTIGGKDYSMKPATFKKTFDTTTIPKIETTYYACNHCVNHWGTDICACGSGRPYDKCAKMGHKICGRPMQVIGGRTHN